MWVVPARQSTAGYLNLLESCPNPVLVNNAGALGSGSFLMRTPLAGGARRVEREGRTSGHGAMTILAVAAGSPAPQPWHSEGDPILDAYHTPRPAATRGGARVCPRP